MKKTTFVGIIFSFLFAALVLGATFYWYEWRPTRIVKTCHQEAREGAVRIMSGISMESAKKGQYKYSDYEKEYRDCLKKNGIEK